MYLRTVVRVKNLRAEYDTTIYNATLIARQRRRPAIGNPAVKK